MAVCQILDRLEIDEVVGIPNAAEDIDLPARYEGVRTIGNAMTPDMEILSQINPEVVIVPRTLEAGLSEQFDNAGIEAMYFDPLERRGHVRRHRRARRIVRARGAGRGAAGGV